MLERLINLLVGIWLGGKSSPGSYVAEPPKLLSSTPKDNPMTEFKKIRMDDIGTRLNHLTELKDLWELAERILSAQHRMFREPEDKNDLEDIKGALSLLNAHMQKDFNEMNYQIEINTLPKPGKP